MAKCIFWFRRDLRLEDNIGLYHALSSGNQVQPVFIFDTNILSELDPEDARVTFIHNTLNIMNETMKKHHSSLWSFFGTPHEFFSELDVSDYTSVYTNHDYEPYAITRDNEIKDILESKGIAFHTFKDQVVFEKTEVLKADGLPYTVFTPYSKRWKERIQLEPMHSMPSESLLHSLATSNFLLISLTKMGFKESTISVPPYKVTPQLIGHYHETRDFPSVEGTSRLSVYLRFGLVSIRKMVSLAIQNNEKFLNELIWREFYQQILWHFPQVVSQSFKPEYDKIKWRNNEAEFKRWCEGQTGYPIVDAGMRELNHTGWMHNRVRMIVASFLTKHLLIDWQWGEAYFAKKLLDFDLASNNGGWQWAAGTGVDAAPYFRVFNPHLQTLKFDANLTYIRKWVPEFDSLQYAQPIVEHKEARERCLQTYKLGLSKN